MSSGTRILSALPARGSNHCMQCKLIAEELEGDGKLHGSFKESKEGWSWLIKLLFRSHYCNLATDDRGGWGINIASVMWGRRECLTKVNVEACDVGS